MLFILNGFIKLFLCIHLEYIVYSLQIFFCVTKETGKKCNSNENAIQIPLKIQISIGAKKNTYLGNATSALIIKTLKWEEKVLIRSPENVLTEM